MKTPSRSSTPSVSVTAPTGCPIIRAASTDITVLEDLAEATTVTDLLRLAGRHPLLWAELNTFHPEVVTNASQIVDGSEQRPKIIRKTTRALSGLIARSAGRATPSRMISTVGEISSSPSNVPGEITLEPTLTITASRSSIVADDKKAEGTILRWNPSAVIMDERCYITAPRSQSTPVFSSVGVNPLIKGIRVWAKTPISGQDLRATILNAYPDADMASIEKVIHQLVKHELLLSEKSIGYDTYRSQRNLFAQEFALEADENHLPAQTEYADEDVDSYRSAVGAPPTGTTEELTAFLEHGFTHGAFEYNDSGLAQVLAQLLLEKYGASRIPLTHLIHPVFGLDWKTVTTSSQARSLTATKSSSDYLRSVYTRGIKSADGWVDLQSEAASLPREKRTYSRLDSLDLIASLHGTPTDPTYNIADAISSIPGGVASARFDLLPSRHLDDEYAINIDWVSPQQAFNSVREFHTSYPRTLNVNSVESHPRELTLDSLQVWSDGTQVHLCDEDGSPLRFRPTSMAGVGAYPEWLMQIAMAATGSTPNINWSWGTISDHVNYLPGVRHGRVIVSRPAFRYRGPEDANAFNEWADSHGISEWVRMGDSDRKILLKRTAPGFSEAVRSQLRRSDGWVYESFDSELTPLVRDHQDRPIFSEICLTFGISSPAPDPDALRTTAQSLSVVATNQDKELLPGISDTANLTIIPRDGFRERVIRRLFSTEETAAGAYFIRYPTDSGESGLRLRYPRRTSTGAAVETAIREMTSSGWLLGLEEKAHSLEFERYGGPAVFPLFSELFSLESRVVAHLSAASSTDTIDERLHLPILDRWLNLFPDYKSVIVEFAVPSEDSSTVQKAASALVREADSPEDLASADLIDPSIRAHMKSLANKISAHSVGTYELQSAAHLFCNRVGISTDREKALWAALSKIERRNHHVNDTHPHRSRAS